LTAAEAAHLSDRQLLGVFGAARDEAAFEALVRRHGALVWGVCRRVAGDHHDAEDAFQASFLVLARKAATLSRGDRLAAWLYGVAYRTALKARALAARRRAREKQVPTMPEPATETAEVCDESLMLLDRELAALPEKYRLAILACDLGGRTQQEAAAELAMPQGTLSARLSRGRALLARRLAKRGITLAAALAAHHAVAPSAPAAAVAGAIQAARVDSAVPAAVLTLAEGVLKAMLLTRLKRLLVVVGGVALLAAVGAVALGAGGEPPEADAAETPPAPVRETQAPQPKDGRAGPVRLGSSNWRFGTHISGLAYANEGRWVVVADGPVVRVLDARTGDEVSSFKAQPYHINSMGVAGDKVVVVGGDKVGHLWDLKRGKKLVTFEAHKNGSQNVRISPDGRYVAATGDDVGRLESVLVYNDYSVRVWDTVTGKQLAPFADGLRTGTVGVFSPDGKHLAWAEWQGRVHLCRLYDGKELFHYDCGAHVELAFSGDGSMLACATAKKVVLLETRTFKERVVCERKDQPTGLVNYRLAFSPNGDTVAAGSEDGSVVFWDTATGKERGRAMVAADGPPGYTYSFIGAMAFSPDGKTLAVAPQDQTVHLLDVATRKETNGQAGRRGVRSVAITPDGKTVLTGHIRGKLSWWDAATGKHLHAAEEPPGGSLLALSKDGSKLYAVEDRQVRLWDVAARKELPCSLKPFEEAPRCLALSPEEDYLATGLADGTILLWDLRSGKFWRLEGHRGEVTALVFTAGGKQLLSASGAVVAGMPMQAQPENAIKLWDVHTGKVVRDVGKTLYSPESLAVSPDGKLAVTNAIQPDGTGLVVWDVTIGKVARRLGPLDGSPSQVAFSPDGRWLAVARGQIYPDTAGYVVLFDTATWKEAHTLRGHVQRISAMAFSADSRYLVTGSFDSSALVWDLADLKK
jgi:RNA polymerase sigma factor (sigma-70 family)